jgi:hypothetical protein
MRTYDSSPTELEGIIGDQNIHDIIDHRLLSTGYPGYTKKYFVDGLPEVVIRHNAGEPEPEQRDKVVKAYNELPLYNVPVLPYVPVEHNGEIYVVTRKMHGVELEEILNRGVPPFMHTIVDERWANITKYLSSGRREGRDCATDIEHFGQHMYGRTAVDDEDVLRLVDLGEDTINYAKPPFSVGGSYERIILVTASTVIEMENAFDRKLAAARRALKGAIKIAIDLGDPTNDYRRAVIDKSKYVLKHGVVINSEDEAELL